MCLSLWFRLCPVDLCPLAEEVFVPRLQIVSQRDTAISTFSYVAQLYCKRGYKWGPRREIRTSQFVLTSQQYGLVGELSGAILHEPSAGKRWCFNHGVTISCPILTCCCIAAVIPPFNDTVDKAMTYLADEGLVGVADFFVSGKWDLPLRQMSWGRRFFWRCASFVVVLMLDACVTAFHVLTL